MAEQGAALQACNNELVKCKAQRTLHESDHYVSLGFEELCHQRDELQRQILIEEEEKRQLETQIHALGQKLSQLNSNLVTKIALRSELDRTITESENAYMKIIESSQTLLDVNLFMDRLHLHVILFHRY